MDADRFDTLARALTGARTRRSALSAVVAGSVLSAFGLGREAPTRTAQAQGDLCVLAGPGGTCVIAFEAIVRQGPSANRPLVERGAAGALRGYLRFSLAGNGSMENADLLLDDGASLPVAGLAIGHGFQARIDLGQGQALVAVGVGEQDVSRCLGRLDGTVTGTEVGDLGEWHATAGVQNIPVVTGRGDQGDRAEESSDRPLSSASGSGNQQAQGSTTTGGNGSSARDTGDDNGLVAETRGQGSANDPSGSGSGASGGRGGSAENDAASPGTGGNERLTNDSSDNRPASQADDDRASVEARQASDDAELVLACPEGQSRCSNVCVDTTSDVFNCGACDRLCALDEDCTNGQCVAVSDAEANANADADADADDAAVGDEAGADAVDDAEAEALTDDEGNACAAGEALCGDVCTDLMTDVINCGVCGITCATGEACEGGMCAPPAPEVCPAGQIRCDGICREGVTNFGSEGISCPGGGGVPTECPVGLVLCNGACFPEGRCQPADCAPGWGYCYGVCRDFQNDPGYCGGCNSGCTGNGYCQGGSCTYCSSSLTSCGTDCVDLQTDLNHCGGCGNVCGTQCINGQCAAVGPSPVRTCPDGLTRCGDFCVDLAVNDANCGACGVVCPAPTHCIASTSGNPPGICEMPAAACYAQGLYPCGMRCVDYDSDPQNCGACYNVCSAKTECQGGLCVITGASQTLAPTDDESEAETAPEAEPGTDPAPEPEAELAPEPTQAGGPAIGW